MSERGDAWKAHLEAVNIPHGSHAETTYIKSAFPGVTMRSTFLPYLSKGFPRKHDAALAKLFGANYDRDFWLEKSATRRRDSGEGNTVHWIGDPISDMEGFCRALAAVYDDASSYSYLRVGGLSSGNRTRVGDEVDDDGLALMPTRPGVRMIYLTPFWDRITAGALCGTSVHVVKSVDRLVELWAAVELLRKRDLLEKNSVHLVQFDDRGRPKIDPSMGVRTADGDKILLSLLPMEDEDTPPYSDWMCSTRLTQFGEQAIARAKMPPTRKLSSLMPWNLEKAMHEAFDALIKSGIDCSRNYGPLDKFEKVKTIKDRMATWPEEVWLPPLG